MPPPLIFVVYSLHPSLSPRRPLIFMRLAGRPRSASLSPSEREEAADCQRLMDFWKTQTAMHHSLQNQGGRERRDWGWSLRGEGREEDIGGTGWKSGSVEVRGKSWQSLWGLPSIKNMYEKYITFHSKFIRLPLWRGMARQKGSPLFPRDFKNRNESKKCAPDTHPSFPWTATEIIATNGDAGHLYLDAVCRCRRTRWFIKSVFVSPPAAPPRLSSSDHRLTSSCFVPRLHLWCLTRFVVLPWLPPSSHASTGERISAYWTRYQRHRQCSWNTPKVRQEHLWWTPGILGSFNRISTKNDSDLAFLTNVALPSDVRFFKTKLGRTRFAFYESFWWNETSMSYNQTYDY